MASKTIEEFLKAARPDQLAELKKEGQDLNRNGVAVKPEFQLNAAPNAKTNATEAHISEPVTQHLASHQRASDRIKQAREQAQQPKAAEPTQAKTIDHER